MGDEGLHAFHKGINLKVNATGRQEFEPACYDVTVQHASYCPTRTLPVEGWESVVWVTLAF